MHRYLRYCASAGVLTALLMWGAVAYGQSVLSTTGLGELRMYQTGRAFGMGDVGLAVMDQYRYNRWNPALGVFLEQTAFNGGLTIDGVKMSRPDLNIENRLTRWNGASLSVKFGNHLSFTAGAAPFSVYDFQLESEGQSFDRELVGSGGISSFYASAAAQYNGWIAFGAALHRYSGKMTDQETVTFSQTGFGSVDNSIRNGLDGVGLTFGAAFRVTDYLTVAGFLQPGFTLTGERVFSAFLSGPVEFTDPISADVPLMFGVGVSHILQGRYHFALDYSKAAMSELQFNNIVPGYATDSRRFGIGFELLPRQNDNYDPVNQPGVRYRIGFYRQQAYIRDIDGSTIDETFFTVGLGVPFIRARSQIDLGLQVGFRGSRENDFASERIIRFNMSVSTIERWFYRPPQEDDDEDDDF